MKKLTDSPWFLLPAAALVLAFGVLLYYGAARYWFG